MTDSYESGKVAGATVAVLFLICLFFYLKESPASVAPAAPAAIGPSIEDQQYEILMTIWSLESGRRMSPPRGANNELGPLQISRAYWQDALCCEGTLALGTYEDCARLPYALATVRGYMTRWVPEAWNSADAEVILRTHNGGPRGAAKSSTLDYWERGRNLLSR